MTQITIRPTPYHLTLPDDAPIKVTAQIALAEWLKANNATDLQHMDEDRGFTIQVETTKPIRERFARYTGLADHYEATLPDGSRIALEAPYAPSSTSPVSMARETAQVLPAESRSLYQEAQDHLSAKTRPTGWKARVTSWLGGSR